MRHRLEKTDVRGREFRYGCIEDAADELFLRHGRTSDDVFEFDGRPVAGGIPRPVSNQLEHKRKSVDGLDRRGEGFIIDGLSSLFCCQAKGLACLVSGDGSKVVARRAANEGGRLAGEQVRHVVGQPRISSMTRRSSRTKCW